MSFQGREYEKDDRWSRVDQYALQHLDQDNPHQAALDYAKEYPSSQGLPNIEVSALQGKFLAVQCQLIKAKHILELGTLGGYSAVWMASTDPDVQITTIEIDVKHKEVAEQVFKHAGLQDRIEVLHGSGLDILPRLRAEVESGKRAQYDFVFIDADKPSNLAYLNEAMLMTRSRACIVVDNVVRKGNLVSAIAAKEDDRVQGSREVVEAVGKDKRVLQSTLLQTVGEKNYDGFLMCVVK